MSEKFVNFSLEVTAPRGWFLEISPVALSVPQGTPAVFAVTARAKGGYESALHLDILWLPAGVVAAIEPAVIPQDGTAVVTIPTDAISEDSDLILQLHAIGAD